MSTQDHRRGCRLARALALVLLVSLIVMGAGHPTLADGGATWFVSPSGSGTACSQAAPCSLTQGLVAASEGDTLYLAGGIYTESGDVVAKIPRTVTLRGGWDGTTTSPPVVAPLGSTTVLDGEDTRRVVHVAAGSPMLEGLTLTRGRVINGSGAGLLADGLTAPILSRCVITGNHVLTGTGGGIALFEASALITGCVVAGNSTASLYSPWVFDKGGGLYAYGGQPTIEQSLFHDNSAFWGGGVMIETGQATLRESRLWGNTATDSGGGAYLLGDDSLLIDGVIAHNTAVYGGGGLYLYDGSTARIEANHIHHNTANSYGGGICSRLNSAGTIANNLIERNSSSGGGGIYLYNADSRIVNNTIANNNLERPGSGIETDCRDGDPVILNNAIISHTVGVYYGHDETLTFALDYNDVWGNSESDYYHVTAGPNSLSLDPLFVDLVGGNYSLRYGSPCLDAGTTLTDVVRDYDGDPRPLGPAYDIGADEAEPTPEPTAPTLVPPTIPPEPTVPGETATPTPTATGTPAPRNTPTPPQGLLLPLVLSNG